MKVYVSKKSIWISFKLKSLWWFVVSCFRQYCIFIELGSISHKLEDSKAYLFACVDSIRVSCGPLVLSSASCEQIFGSILTLPNCDKNAEMLVFLYTHVSKNVLWMQINKIYNPPFLSLRRRILISIWLRILARSYVSYVTSYFVVQ